MATEEFSYQADIEPIRGKLINGKSQSAFEYERTLDKQHQLDILDIQESGRRREEDFRTRMDKLDAEAKEKRALNKALEQLPSFTEKLDRALNGANPDEAVQEVAREFASSIAKDDSYKIMVTAAIAQRAAEKAARKEFESGVLSRLPTLGPDATRVYIDGSDLSDSEKDRQRSVVDSYEKALNKSQESKSSEKRQTADEARGLSTLDTYDKTLRAMETQTIEDGPIARSLKPGGKPVAAPEPPKLSFSAEDKIEIIEILVDLNPAFDTPEQRKALNDLPETDLFRTAVNSVTTARRRRDPNTSSPAARDKFAAPATPE